MRVWLVNHYALPPSEPGGTRHYTLARELIRSGHDVTVIASSFNHATGMQMGCTQGKLRTFESFGEVPFLLLRVPSYRSNITRLWNMCVFAFEVWLGLGTRGLRKPDIVIGSSLTLFAAFATERLARRLDVPFVLEIRDLWPQTLINMGMRPRHPAVIGFGMIERYLYRNADKIVTLLPNAAKYMVPRGARSSDITWIPNGVDMELMPFPQVPTPHDVFTVMYAGSHGLSDALDSVLDAAGILNTEAPGRFCFRFIGSGPNKRALRQRVETEGIAKVVVFDEPVPRQQVFSTLQNADAFIITARKTDLYRYGMSPNKLHEYMAAARPTIFAGNSHNNPIAEASAGITVAPEDSRAIATAVKTLAAMSSDERWNMGLRARRYIEEHHDFTALASRLERVLQSALTLRQPIRNETPALDVEHTDALEVENVHTQ
jgi:glycosyltransferase involved in cell wall biosynthesis